MFYGLRSEADFEEFMRCVNRIGELCSGGKMFVADNLLTVQRNMGFIENGPFMRAFLQHAGNFQESSLVWRLHLLCWAAENALHLPGDFVECGVWRGFSSLVIASYLDFAAQPKQFYLYDTFTGIPAEHAAENVTPEILEIINKQFREHGLFDTVCRRFEPFPNARVIQGRVPEILHEQAPEQISFLHLDMNSAVAEIGALEVLFDRLVPGGYLLLDDYGWYIYREQKIAEDAFMRARGYSIAELPTGQGLVIKR